VSLRLLRRLGLRVRGREHRIRKPLFKRWVVLELLEKFRVIGKEFEQDPLERLVVFDPGVLFVGILHGVCVILVTACVRTTTAEQEQNEDGDWDEHGKRKVCFEAG
jgi:hypothetical protein